MSEDIIKCSKCDRTCINRLVDHCLYCMEPYPVSDRLSDEEKILKDKSSAKRESKRKPGIGNSRTRIGRTFGSGGDC